MTTREYFDFATGFFGKCMELSKKKNYDYTKGAGDDSPFANLRACEAYGIPGERGVFVRMLDKMSRISSYLKKGKLQVDDESITDTLRDLANYSALLAGMLEENKRKVDLEDRLAKRESIKRTSIDDVPMSELRPGLELSLEERKEKAKSIDKLKEDVLRSAEGVEGHSGPVGQTGSCGVVDKKDSELDKMGYVEINGCCFTLSEYVEMRKFFLEERGIFAPFSVAYQRLSPHVKLNSGSFSMVLTHFEDLYKSREDYVDIQQAHINAARKIEEECLKAERDHHMLPQNNPYSNVSIS